MKVGIDTFGCDHGRSGLGSYLLSLTKVLPQEENVIYELFGPEVDRYTYTGSNDIKFVSVSVPDSLSAERLWHQFRMNRFGKKQGYDVVLYPAGSRMMPTSFRVPGIAVVNDIVTNLFDETDDYLMRRQVKKGLSHADCIIASSNFIKKDLERFGFAKGRIEVIYNGIDHDLFFPADSVSSSDIIDIKPFAIKKPYLIYASRMRNADKKHIELIRAFSLFKKRTGLSHRLVIAGSGSLYSDAVRKEAYSCEAASDIFITGYFPHENFPELYRNADACVFPSITEGVGLSVLEAMASGLPVACAKAGALPEVAGDNALYFDSNNIEDIAQAMQTIVIDQKLRTRLISGGIERVKKFSWRETATKTLNLIKEVAEKHLNS